MLPTDLSIAQTRICDLLAEAETSRLAARLRKTGRRPARGRWRLLAGYRRQGVGAAAASRS
jgi:hypothetical protein